MNTVYYFPNDVTQTDFITVQKLEQCNKKA